MKEDRADCKGKGNPCQVNASWRNEVLIACISLDDSYKNSYTFLRRNI